MSSATPQFGASFGCHPLPLSLTHHSSRHLITNQLVKQHSIEVKIIFGRFTNESSSYAVCMREGFGPNWRHKARPDIWQARGIKEGTRACLYARLSGLSLPTLITVQPCSNLPDPCTIRVSLAAARRSIEPNLQQFICLHSREIIDVDPYATVAARCPLKHERWAVQGPLGTRSGQLTCGVSCSGICPYLSR